MTNITGHNTIPTDWLVLDLPLDWNATARVWTSWTATNVTWTGAEKWYVDEVWVFNGTNAYIDMNTVYQYTSTDDFSLCCRVKFTSTGNSSWIMVNDWFWASPNKWFGLLAQADWSIDFRLVAWSWTASNVGTATNYWDWNWHFLLWTYNWTTKLQSLYIDNSLVASATYWTTWDFYTTNSELHFWNVNYEVQPWIFIFTWNIWLAKIYSKLLSEQEIHNLYLEWQRRLWDRASYPALLNWLVAYYDMKWDANDVIGGYNGTVNWAILTTDYLWKSNSAYSFDWVNDFISTPNGAQNFWTWDFTISMIINKNTNWTAQTIWSNLTPSSVTWIAIYYTSLNQLTFETWGAWSNNIIQTTSISPSTSTDYHIVCIKSWTSLSVYIDNVVPATTTFGSGNKNVSNAVAWAFWKYTFNNTLFWDWTISNTLMLNRALSADEVTNLYQLFQQDYIYPFSKSSTLNLQNWLVMSLDWDWNDVSWNGNNGTPTAVTKIRKNQTNGWSYNGSTSYISVPDFAYNMATSFTYNAWIKVNNYSDANGIIQHDKW